MLFNYSCGWRFPLQLGVALVLPKFTYYPFVFYVSHRSHSQVGHSGRDKTWAKVKDTYSRIPHGLVQIFLKTCLTCVPRAKVKKAPCGKPIISCRFLQRLQMDLIDFTSHPDGDMKWILHMRDHFSKYSWAHALPNKQAAGVAAKLKTTFCMFGAPEILQVFFFLHLFVHNIYFFRYSYALFFSRERMKAIQ